MLSINSNTYQLPVNSSVDKSTVESISIKLKNLNESQNTNILFIDILEKISLNMSSEEKFSIANDNQLLINKIDSEINSINGSLSYLENSIKESSIPSELLKTISDLKSRILKETDPEIKKKLELELFSLEAQLISNL